MAYPNVIGTLPVPAYLKRNQEQRTLLQQRYQQARRQMLPRALRDFRSIPPGRLGFDPVQFEDVYWNGENLPPKIYDLEGIELVLPGPFSAKQIEARIRVRLVELLLFQGMRSRRVLSLSYAWQGEYAFHLLTNFIVLEDTSLAFREELHQDEFLYADTWRRARQDDWFLDVELDV